MHKAMKKKNKPKASPDPVELCVQEVNAVLKKYGCRIDVEFSDAVVLGRTMIEYKSVINAIPKP